MLILFKKGTLQCTHIFMATPPSGPSGNTSEYEMSVATAPFAIFDELQVKGPEPPQYVHTNQMLKNYIPDLFDTYIFRHDNNTTKETWNRLLEMTEMISLKELKWVICLKIILILIGCFHMHNG